MGSTYDLKVSTALDYAEAAADRNGATLDMKGYDGVLMVVKFAAIAAGAVTSIKAQQDSASNMGTAADLEGTSITVADDDDNQVFIIDLEKPAERYVRLVVDKDAANNTAEDAIYVQYGPGYKPQTNAVTDEVTIERHVTPDEGTA
ncbi:MAG: hypothetical protein JXE06_02820 [Coriobacteriia bacterium]|nr:hypothetical protein [Coriobacteriia bacterium]